MLSLFDGYINTLKQKLSGTNAYKETSKKKSILYGHCNHLALKVSVNVNPCPAEPRYTLPLQTV